MPEEFRCLRCWRRAARWFAPKMEKHQNTPTTSQSSPCKPHTLVWRASARLRWDDFGRACATASAGTAYVSSLRRIPGRLVAGPSSRLLPKKDGSRFKGWCSSAVRVQARQPPHTCHAHAATVASSRGHPPRTSARHPCAEDDKAKVREPARVVDAGWWQALTPHGVVDPAGTRVCQTLRASTGAPP